MPHFPVKLAYYSSTYKILFFHLHSFRLTHMIIYNLLVQDAFPNPCIHYHESIFLDEKKFNALEWIGFVGVTAYYATLFFTRDHTLLLMCIVALFMAEMFCYVAAFPKYQASQVMAAVFSFLYAPVLLSFAYLTRECENGIYLVWLILISSWGCDTCAYVVGKLIGKKHIFPELSPHKSLEGCIGGVAGAALIGGLYAHFFVEAALPSRFRIT